MCDLWGAGPALVQKPCTGGPVNAAQSKEEAAAVHPAAAAADARAGESQVDTHDVTMLEPIRPKVEDNSMGEAMLNEQHAATFEQQKPLFAHHQRGTIAAQPARIVSAALPCIVPFPPMCWPRKLSRPPHKEQTGAAVLPACDM
jgi:hypothetical protein